MKNALALITIILFLINTKIIGQPLDEKLQQHFDKSSIPSCIMGSVDKKGKLNWFAFGPAIWKESDPVNADNIFRIASMTKPITCVAALQLVERGLIKLDDPLNDLLPEMVAIPILEKDGTLTYSKAPITLRQLLTHTAGFAYGFTSARLRSFKPEKWEHKDQPRIFAPGTSWHYGTSTYWVGKVVEKISGQDLETYFRAHITGPLNMNHTWFNVPDSLTHKIVSWGGINGSGNYNEWNRIPKQIVTDFAGDAGLFSSLNDYARFLECILNYGKYPGGRILKKETVELMLQDQLPKGMEIKWEGINAQTPAHRLSFADATDKWSFFGAIRRSDDGISQASWWCGAFNTYFTVDMKRKQAIIFLSQLNAFPDKERYEFYKFFEEEILLKNKE